jgi:hypothetical protein
MLAFGVTRYVDFVVKQIDGSAVSGLGLGSFSIVFLRDNLPCSDTLSLTGHSNGLYTVSYTPSDAGHDFLQLTYAAAGVVIEDNEDIVPASVFNPSSLNLSTILNHDYPTPGNLLVSIPNAVNYRVYVFRSSDWDGLLRDPDYALGYSALDSAGHWAQTVTVIDGTYDIVAISIDGHSTVIIKSYLSVVSPNDSAN